jgi:hypothetical protein
MHVTWAQVAVILAAGFVAGFVNALAGGGSFLSLAALEMAGLPAAMANGTNRVALVVESVLAFFGFRSKGISDLRQSIQFAIPALLGAIVGVYVVIELPTVIFHRALAVAMLVMLATIVLNPGRWLQHRQVELTRRRKLLAYPVFFAIGIYGGAIQAGVGFFLMAALVLVAGLDLVRTNSHKAVIVGVYTVFALGMFAMRGQVSWLVGLVLAVGNGSGAWIAGRLAAERGELVVRIVLGIALAALSLRYLGVISPF